VPVCSRLSAQLAVFPLRLGYTPKPGIRQVAGLCYPVVVASGSHPKVCSRSPIRWGGIAPICGTFSNKFHNYFRLPQAFPEGRQGYQRFLYPIPILID